MMSVEDKERLVGLAVLSAVRDEFPRSNPSLRAFAHESDPEIQGSSVIVDLTLMNGYTLMNESVRWFFRLNLLTDPRFDNSMTSGQIPDVIQRRIGHGIDGINRKKIRMQKKSKR